MTYSFRCEKCSKVEDRSIPMAHYDEQSKTQRCSCGEIMVRVLEAPTSIRLCDGMYGTNGGWNK